MAAFTRSPAFLCAYLGLPPWLGAFTSLVGRIYLAFTSKFWRVDLPFWARLLPKAGAFTSQVRRVYLASRALFLNFNGVSSATLMEFI